MGWIVGMRACGVCVFEHAEYVAPVRVGEPMLSYYQGVSQAA